MTRIRRWRPDVTSLAGIPAGIGLVLLGQTLKGGALDSVVQATAAVVVFGGTLGAVLVSFPLDEVRRAVGRLRVVFFSDEPSASRLVRAMVELAVTVRRQGLIAIDEDLDQIGEPFLAKGLRLVVDGHSPETVRELLELEDRAMHDRENAAALVYEAAGGYAPTFGILGAVLGLIQVMERLTEPAGLGAGIAVAFVATAYGVGAANLMFLPIATKLRTRARRAASRRELMVEGILAIQEGVGPQLLQVRLDGFLEGGMDVTSRRLRQVA